MVRGFIDEYSEEPEGIIKDTESEEIGLDSMINVAQENIQLMLIPWIPKEFRKSFLISLEADKYKYDISADCKVSDFFAMENIFHNESGKKPQGLLYVEPDQVHELDIDVGQKGDPQCWLYEERAVIGFRPTPSVSYANRYLAYYFKKVWKLTHDDASEHDPEKDQYSIPELPEASHFIIAMEAAKLLILIDGGSATEIDKVINKNLFNMANNIYGLRPSFSLRTRFKLKDSVRQ